MRVLRRGGGEGGLAIEAGVMGNKAGFSALPWRGVARDLYSPTTS